MEEDELQIEKKSWKTMENTSIIYIVLIFLL